jgi:hypothetical protein
MSRASEHARLAEAFGPQARNACFRGEPDGDGTALIPRDDVVRLPSREIRVERLAAGIDGTRIFTASSMPYLQIHDE